MQVESEENQNNFTFQNSQQQQIKENPEEQQPPKEQNQNQNYNGFIKQLNYLEVRNFKSFSTQESKEETVKIGPFTHFTTILGPNGCGKSNIIDALCFLFGINLSSMRSLKIEDLINNQVNNEEDKEAFVMAQFVIDRQGQQNKIEFKRSLEMVAGKPISSFFINNQETGREEYMGILETYKIVPQAKNFLLMQGETDGIASKSPEELREYFEKLCGSIKYEKEYESLSKLFFEIEEKIQKQTSKVTQLKQEKRKMKQVRDKNKEYQTLIDKIESLEKQQYLMELLNLDKKMEYMSKQLVSLVGKIKAQEGMKVEIRKQLIQRDENLEVQRTNLKEKKEQLEKNKEIYQSNVQKIQQIEQDLRNKHGYLVTYEGNLEEAKRKIEKEQIEFKNLSEQKANIESELQELVQEQDNQLTQNMEGQQRQEFEILNNESKDKNYRYSQEISKLNAEKGTIQAQIDIFQQEISSFNQQIKDQNNQMVELKEQIKRKQEQKGIFEQEQKVLKEKQQQLQQQREEQKEKYQKLSKLKIENEMLQQQLDLLVQNQLEENEADTILFELKKSVRGCRGTLGQKIKPVAQKYEIGLKQALGKCMRYIMVDSEQDAIKCQEILFNKGIAKEILILNNLPQFDDKLQQVKDEIKKYRSISISPAYSTVRILDASIPNLDGFVRYFLNQKVLVDNYKEASKIKDKVIFREIIGLEDRSVLNVGQGMIKSYGNDNIFSNFKFGDGDLENKERAYNQKFQGIKKNIDKNEKLITELGDFDNEMEFNSSAQALFDINASIETISTEISKLQRKELEINDIQKNLQSSTQINQINYQSAQKQKELQEMVQDIQKLEVELKKVDDEIFKDFCQKYNIENIQAFKQKDLAQIEMIHKQIQHKKHNLNTIQKELDENRLEKAEKDYEKFKSKIDFIHNSQKTLNEKSQKLNQDIQNYQAYEQTNKEELEKLNTDLENLENENKESIQQVQQTRSEKFALDREKVNLDNLISKTFSEKLRIIEDCRLNAIELEFNQNSSQIYEHIQTQIQNQVIGTQIISQKNFDDNCIDYSGIDKLIQKLNQLYNDFVEQLDYEDQMQEESEIVDNVQLGDLEEILGDQEKEIQKELNKVKDDLADKNESLEEYHSKTLNEGILGDNDAFLKLNENIEKISTDLKEKLDEKDKIKKDLDDVKNKRKTMFLNFFDQVSQKINKNYQRLNQQSSRHRSAGQAQLFLEDKNEPYRAGIIYSPNPPGKVHVFDIEGQLSGGEKTMATLALFFTINEVLKTPFLIFDEADAYLDLENTRNYLQYLKQISQDHEDNSQYRTQCFVITHKKQVYEKCESFIGVTLNRFKNSTQIFSYLND